MNQQIYDQARTHWTWRDCSHFGQFRVSGADAVTLLHHLTTNNIKGLKTGASCDAVLISHKGRVLDWLTVARDENAFLVITSPNRRTMFKPHAEKFILFRQDVQIEEINSPLWAAFGPQVKQDGFATHRLPGGGFFVLNGDFPGSPACDDKTYNVLRVEAGVPVTGLELTESFNPWEAGLDDAISLHKGCYNGQEIIARLNTYKKVKQGLFGLRLESEISLSQLANAPAKLLCEGRDAGLVTSSAHSPRFGPIALAYVRGDYQAPGQKLQISLPDSAQPATVCALPFAE
ncbi:MAG TPA: glycine cleavage T C-terminal barrel domain-containing protein [Abditibacteriaceae bacterium]|jgi:folate-binding protein YgfZ